MQKIQVALLGLNTLFGRVSSYLLKQSKAVKRLCLYDEHNIESAKDIAIINSSCKVEAFLGKEQLNHALKDADIVIIGDENLSTPYTAFDLMAPKICDYAKAIANSSPNAIIVVAASPVNILVPLLSEVLKECGCYDCNKVIGATAVDNARASCILANYMKANPQKLVVPVIGGASRDTRVPLFSQARPCPSLTKDAWSKLVTDIKENDNTIFSLKKMPEELNKAYTTVKFLNSIFAGLKGEPNNVSIAFSRTSQIPNIDYFALPVQFGRFGIQQRFGLPKVLSFENDLINESIIYLKKDLEHAKQFFKSKEGAIELCGRNLSKGQNKQTEYKSISNFDSFQKDHDNDVAIFQKPVILNSKLRKSLTSTPLNIMVKPWDKPFDVKSFCLKNVGNDNSSEVNTSFVPTLNPLDIFSFRNKCIKQVQARIGGVIPFPKFLTSLENPVELVPNYTSPGSLIDSISSKFEDDEEDKNIKVYKSKPKVAKEITGLSNENEIKLSIKKIKRKNISGLKLSADGILPGKKRSSNQISKNDNNSSNSFKHKLPESNIDISNENQSKGTVKNVTISSTVQPYSSKNLFVFNTDRTNKNNSILLQVQESKHEESDKNTDYSDKAFSSFDNIETKAIPNNSPTYSLVTKNAENSQYNEIPPCIPKEGFQVAHSTPCKTTENNNSFASDDSALMAIDTNAKDFEITKTADKEGHNVESNDDEIVLSFDNKIENKSSFLPSKEYNSNSCKILTANKKTKLNWEKVNSSRKLSSYNRSHSSKMIENGNTYLKYRNIFLERKDSKKSAQDPFQNLMQTLNDEVYSDGITDFIVNNDQPDLPTNENRGNESINTQEQNLLNLLDTKNSGSDAVRISGNISQSQNPLLVANDNVRKLSHVHPLNDLLHIPVTPEHINNCEFKPKNNVEFSPNECKSSLKEINVPPELSLKKNSKAIKTSISETNYTANNENSSSSTSNKPTNNLGTPKPLGTQNSQGTISSPINKWHRRKTNPLKVSESVHCICKKIPQSTMHSNFLKLKVNRFRNCISCLKDKHIIKKKLHSPKSSTPKQNNINKKLLNSTKIKEYSSSVAAVRQKHDHTFVSVDAASKNSSALKNTCKALNENIKKIAHCGPLQVRTMSANHKRGLYKNKSNNNNITKTPKGKDKLLNQEIIKNGKVSSQGKRINSAKSYKIQNKEKISKRKQNSFNTIIESKEQYKKSVPHTESCSRTFFDMIKSKNAKSNVKSVSKPCLNKTVSKPNNPKNLLNVIEKHFGKKSLSPKTLSKDNNREKDSSIAHLIDLDKIKKPTCTVCNEDSHEFYLKSILNKKNKPRVTEKIEKSLKECNSVSQGVHVRGITNRQQNVENLKKKAVLSKFTLKGNSVYPMPQGSRKLQDPASYSPSSATSYLLRDKLKSPYSELYLSRFSQSNVSEDFSKSNSIRNLYSDFTKAFSHGENSKCPKLPSLAFLRSQSWNI